ncbi:hypothetical protein [Nostoc sp.]|uniref:hypothetical protein n=1 Tax=Nostoc sp. TaxID=1180 RepID=UPI002FFAAF5D
MPIPIAWNTAYRECLLKVSLSQLEVSFSKLGLSGTIVFGAKMTYGFGVEVSRRVKSNSFTWAIVKLCYIMSG